MHDLVTFLEGVQLGLQACAGGLDFGQGFATPSFMFSKLIGDLVPLCQIVSRRTPGIVCIFDLLGARYGLIVCFALLPAGVQAVIKASLRLVCSLQLTGQGVDPFALLRKCGCDPADVLQGFLLGLAGFAQALEILLQTQKAGGPHLLFSQFTFNLLEAPFDGVDLGLQLSATFAGKLPV